MDSFRISSIEIVVVEIYILNAKDPDYFSHLISKSNNPYQLRDDNKSVQPLRQTTKFGTKCFAYFSTHLWNMLAHHMKNSVFLYNFRSFTRNGRVLLAIVLSIRKSFDFISVAIDPYLITYGFFNLVDYIWKTSLPFVALIYIIHIYLVLLT